MQEKNHFSAKYMQERILTETYYMRTLTSANPHQCSMCNKTFSTCGTFSNTVVRNHINVVTARNALHENNV